MKNLKRVLALVTVLSMLMSVSAFAAVDSMQKGEEAAVSRVDGETTNWGETFDDAISYASSSEGLNAGASDNGTMTLGEGTTSMSGNESIDFNSLTIVGGADNSALDLGGKTLTTDDTIVLNNVDVSNGVIEAASTEETKAVDETTHVNTGDSNTFDDGNVIETKGDVTLTNVTVDANGEARAVSLVDGTLTLEAGTKITEGNRAGSGGGILVVGPGKNIDGTLILKEGSEVSGNYASNWGGGIANYKTVIMDGGTVSENQAGLGSGGINVQGSSGDTDPNAGTFTMNGGTVSNNKTDTDNISGGIGTPWGTVTINGGTVENNTNAGGSYGLNVDGQVTINGGEIKDPITVGTYTNASLTINRGTFTTDDAATQTLIETEALGDVTTSGEGTKTYVIGAGVVSVSQTVTGGGTTTTTVATYATTADGESVTSQLTGTVETVKSGGTTTVTEKNAANQVIRSSETVVEANGVTTTTTRDGNGVVTSVTVYDPRPAAAPEYYDSSDDSSDDAPAPVTIVEEETPLAALPEGFGLTLDDAIEIAIEYTVVSEDADAVTRAEFVRTLYLLAEASGVDVSNLADLVAFLDADEISDDDLLTALRWAVGAGIVYGVSEDRLAPNANLTQWQLDLIMARFEAYLAASAEP